MPVTDQNRAAILDDAMLAPASAEIAPGVRVRRLSLRALRRLTLIAHPLAAAASGNASTAAEIALQDLLSAAFILSADEEEWLAFYAATPLVRERLLDAFAGRLQIDSLRIFAEFLNGDNAAISAAQAEAVPDENHGVSKNAPRPAESPR